MRVVLVILLENFHGASPLVGDMRHWGCDIFQPRKKTLAPLCEVAAATTAWAQVTTSCDDLPRLK